MLASCSKSATAPPDTVVRQVNISPSSASQLTSGMTLQFSATGLNAENSVVSGATATWSSSAPTVASISATGLVTGLLTGTATITATMSGVSSQGVTVTVVPGAPATLAMRTQPTGAVAGLPLTVQPVIEIHDAVGNVANSGAVVTAAIGSAGDTLSGTMTVTAVAGVATFTDLSVAGPVDTVTLSFSATGLTGVTSAPFVIHSGVPAQYGVTVSTASPAAGDTVTVTAQLQDADSFPVAKAGHIVTWNATGAVGSLAAATSTTDTSGAATVRFATGPVVGSYTVTATDSSGLTGTSPTFTSVAGPASMSTSLVQASPAALLADGHSTSAITVTLEDANRNALTASAGTVVIAATAGTLSATTDNGNGRYSAVLTAPTTTGSAIVRATLNGYTLSATDTVDFVTSGETKYVVSLSSASPVAGDTVTVIAQLADTLGNSMAIAGRTVTWSATGTGGSFAAPTSTTNSSGTATVHFTTGPLVSGYTVTATDTSGATGTSPTFTSVPGPASISTSLVQANPTTLPTDGTSTSAITVTLEDANGNALQTSAGTVLIAVTTGSISATTDNGNGTYGAVLTAPTRPGSAIVSATLNGTALSARDTVTCVRTSSEEYLVSVSKTSPVAGDTLTVSAQLADTLGNPQAVAGRTVTWSATGAGESFSAGSSTTDINGIATVVLTTGPHVGSYTVTATDTSGAAGISPTFTSVPGPVSTSTSLVQADPTAILADGTSTSAITVTLEDANGNALTASAGTVVIAATAGSISATLDRGNGTYGAVLTAPTTTGSAIVSATLNGSALSATDTVTFATNNVVGYVLSVGNASPAAGDTVTVSAQISDGAGNPVALPGRVVTWQSSGVGGALANATSITDANGTATMLFTTSTTAGAETITATDAGGYTGSVTLTSVADAPAAYVLTTSASAPVAGAAITLSAQLVDAYGNKVFLAGRTASWTVTGESGGTFSPQTSQTSASGIATTSYTTGTSIGTQYTITAVDGQGTSGTVNIINQEGTAQSVQWTGPSRILITDSTMSLSDFTAVNQYGRTDTTPTLSFVSRTTAAAAVNSSGLVTPIALGQTMVVASDPSNASATDSVLVAVADSDGPVVRTGLSRFDLKSDTTFTVTLIVDMPAGDSLGAITMALTWDPALLTYVSDAEAGSNVGASVNTANAANGTLLLTAASSSGFAGSVQLRTVTFRAAATTGLSGTLHLGVTELNAATTFTDLLPKTVAITYPLITR